MEIGRGVTAATYNTPKGVIVGVIPTLTVLCNTLFDEHSNGFFKVFEAINTNCLHTIFVHFHQETALPP